MSELISIKQAVAEGIDRLRQPHWADPDDYLKIDIVDGGIGPWLHLFSPSNQEINGRNPVDFLCTGVDSDTPEWLPYEPKEPRP